MVVLVVEVAGCEEVASGEEVVRRWGKFAYMETGELSSSDAAIVGYRVPEHLQRRGVEWLRDGLLSTSRRHLDGGPAFHCG